MQVATSGTFPKEIVQLVEARLVPTKVTEEDVA